jgi:hypothetical protein
MAKDVPAIISSLITLSDLFSLFFSTKEYQNENPDLWRRFLFTLRFLTMKHERLLEAITVQSTVHEFQDPGSSSPHESLLRKLEGLYESPVEDVITQLRAFIKERKAVGFFYLFSMVFSHSFF